MQTRVLAAFIFCLAGFLIGFLLLLSGIKGNLLEDFAMLTWHSDDDLDMMSYSGAGAGAQALDSLLLPYYEWRSAHYFSICQGFYSLDSNVKVDGTCYTAATVRDVFPPGIGLRIQLVFWFIGVALSGLCSLLLPFFLGGRVHHNRHIFRLFILILIAWAISIGDIIAFYALTNKSGSTFLVLSLVAFGCVLIGHIIHSFEYGLEGRFTPEGAIISATYKPKDFPWRRVPYSPRDMEMFGGGKGIPRTENRRHRNHIYDQTYDDPEDSLF